MKLNKIVTKCLEEDVSARNSDWILFKDVCKKLKIDVANISVEEMCNHHNDLNFPSFESVRRTRQKIQESGKYKPNAEVQMFRNLQEERYRKEFGRNA